MQVRCLSFKKVSSKCVNVNCSLNNLFWYITLVCCSHCVISQSISDWSLLKVSIVLALLCKYYSAKKDCLTARCSIASVLDIPATLLCMCIIFLFHFSWEAEIHNSRSHIPLRNSLNILIGWLQWLNCLDSSSPCIAFNGPSALFRHLSITHTYL